MNEKREDGEVDMVVMLSELNHANNRRLIDLVDEELGPGGVDLVLSADMHEETPKIIYTKNGTAVCNFSVATDEGFGESKKTTWHNVVVWEKSGEACSKYLVKGSLVFVQGRTESREWEDKDGNKRRTTEVIAFRVQFLDSKRRDDDAPPADSPSHSAPDSEIPF